jgi:hypothetical protein
MNTLYTSAIRKASEVRIKLGLDLFEPINIYDVCSSLEIDIRFVDVNMEGLYVNNKGISQILLSCLRPFPRRTFTCAHELGHHIFNHGLKVDVISDESADSSVKSSDEILVDAFAAALLMPVGGIQAEFTKRNMSFQSATPIDFYVISSVFGVGYQTLITHCKVNRLINDLKSIELLKFTPAKIFKAHFGNVEEKSFFKIIDGKCKPKSIDLEVSNYIVLPSDFIVNDDFLDKKYEAQLGSLFLAKRPGISSVHSNETETSYFIRIQPQNYVGFAEYRHLEN